jgi:uncharacterized protein YjiS (DUF1127 family)
MNLSIMQWTPALAVRNALAHSVRRHSRQHMLRRDVSRVSDMDSRLLADIGIGRCEIHDVIALGRRPANQATFQTSAA